MFLSVFDLFKSGVGPSSSHTMGPMVAGARFLDELRALALLRPAACGASLHGSLAFTGKGHATDRGTILGLAGFVAGDLDPDAAEAALAANRESRQLSPRGPAATWLSIPTRDLRFDYDHALPGHANGMTLSATDAQGDVILRRVYYSIGGGFVLTEEELARRHGEGRSDARQRAVPLRQRRRDAGDGRKLGQVHRPDEARTTSCAAARPPSCARGWRRSGT